MPDWHLFTGSRTPSDRIADLPDPPPWRQPGQWRQRRGLTWVPTDKEIELVNAALHLRRPLLVTGPPGSGKTSLAYAVAAELQLGEVLEWPVNSRTTLQDGLYTYDAVARLRDLSIAKARNEAPVDRVGDYLRLGPLGTALATSTPKRPRVLLIDEIDKADVDFPNDLLHVLENGEFDLAELHRERSEGPHRVRPSDEGAELEITKARVTCTAMPLLVITSNGERELAPAFLRRCLRLDVSLPERPQLLAILRTQLGEPPDEHRPAIDALVDAWLAGRKKNQTLATDQLLNAVFLVTHGHVPDLPDRKALLETLLRDLGAE